MNENFESRSFAQINELNNRTLLEEALSGIAHQIHHPLYVISDYARTCKKLLENQPPPNTVELREMLEGITQAVNTSRDIILQLRELSHQRSMVRKQVQISTVIDSAIQAMELDSPASKQIRVLDQSVTKLPIDPIQIQNVLVILLRNAIESMCDRPLHQRIVSVSSECDPQFLTVSVGDSGCGLPDSIKMNVFEAFVTSKPTRLGLGLAISRTIIENHGGRIWYELKTGDGGMIFRFRLPKRPPPTSREVLSEPQEKFKVEISKCFRTKS